MLNTNITMTFGAVVLAFFPIGVSFAQTVYGSQLMSPQEWAEHRAMMRSLDPSEREAYRAQHHETMKKRAESMGLSLPNQPPAQRRFGPKGPGYGYGRSGRGYWAPGYRQTAPWQGGGDYGAWPEYEGYGPGYGGWGYPTW